MNWVDLLILTITAAISAEGIRRGFASQLLDICGFFISLVVSLNFYPHAAQLLIKFFNLPKIAANPVGFLFTWLLTEAIFFTFFSSIAGKILTKMPKFDFIEKYLGFVPSTINTLLFAAFVLLFVVSLPINPLIKKDIYDSKIGSFLVSSATVFEKPLNSVFGPIAKQSLTFLTVKPEETGSIPLEFTQSELTVDLASERIMFDLVNQERVKVGVKPLVWDENLTHVGRTHSQDMFERGYFSHYSPEGEDVGDRLGQVGIDYSLAGENLALAPNVNRAHTGLMNSPGHRRNILDPAFTKVGIGAIDGGIYGKMFTQVFNN